MARFVVLELKTEHMNQPYLLESLIYPKVDISKSQSFGLV